MNLWDKKAKTYARYQNTLNTIQKQTFEYLQNLNISFQNKSIYRYRMWNWGLDFTLS